MAWFYPSSVLDCCVLMKMCVWLREFLEKASDHDRQICLLLWLLKENPCVHLQPGATWILKGFGSIAKLYKASLNPKVMSMKCLLQQACTWPLPSTMEWMGKRGNWNHSYPHAAMCDPVQSSFKTPAELWDCETRYVEFLIHWMFFFLQWVNYKNQLGHKERKKY